MWSRGTTTPRASGVWAGRLGTAAGVRAAAGLAVPRAVVPRVVVPRLVAAGVVMATGLAGCSGGPEPTPSATSTAIHESPWPTPTPTPTPTPADPAAVPPERPAAMDEVDDAGAQAVATYFLALYPYAYATGDLTEWRALSHPECVFCASVISNVEEQLAAGHHNEGSEITVEEIHVVEIADGEHYGVTARVTEGPSRELDASGAIVGERSEAQEVILTFAIVVDGGWFVREVDTDAPTGSS